LDRPCRRALVAPAAGARGGAPLTAGGVERSRRAPPPRPAQGRTVPLPRSPSASDICRSYLEHARRERERERGGAGAPIAAAASGAPRGGAAAAAAVAAEADHDLWVDGIQGARWGLRFRVEVLGF
jgi:hypothetical protein